MYALFVCVLVGLVAYYLLVRFHTAKHSDQYLRIAYLSNQISERLLGFPEYVYDEDVVLSSREEFDDFDSCLWLCNKMRKDGCAYDRIAGFSESLKENLRLYELYRNGLQDYDYDASEFDRKTRCPWVLPFLWHFCEKRLIRACRPRFQLECVARVSWRHGHHHESFLYNSMALAHMVDWCHKKEAEAA